MLEQTPAFSGFAVRDMTAAKQFYGQTLGVIIEDQGDMGITLKLAGGNDVFVYAKEDHAPATFTLLNFAVADIDATIDQMTAAGVVFEHYDFSNGAKTDDKGVMRGKDVNMSPNIAWFKDPSGNILSILED
jgi:predicted enzyme related to lactoylglutathione lyase